MTSHLANQPVSNPELFDEAYVNALARQEARSAAIGAAGYASLLLEHSKDYSRKPRRDALIGEVREALIRFLSPLESNDPEKMRELVENISGHNVAAHFRQAWKEHDPDLRSVIDKHGLYFVGLAALSLSKPGDSIVAVCELLCMINTWNAGQIAQVKKQAARVGRKPEREFIKMIMIDMIKSEGRWIAPPKISPTQVWNAAKSKINYTVKFNHRYFKFDAEAEGGKLHVMYFETDSVGESLEKRILDAYWDREQFKSLVRKLKMEID